MAAHAMRTTVQRAAAAAAVTPMRVQFASDLHLEVPGPGKQPRFEALLTPAAPYLALCGDIGRADRPDRLRAFLAWCAQRWARVFYVAGNHEHWGEDADRWQWHPAVAADEVVARLASLAGPHPNVHVLDRTAVALPEHGVEVLGATLWSDVPRAQWAAAVAAANDYRRIADAGGRRVGPADTSAWHRRDAAWLDGAITAAAGRGAAVLVLTHHLPTHALVAPRYAAHPLTACFATECGGLLRPPVQAWLCGHTHTAGSAVVGGVACSVNPRGYPGEADTGYRCDAVVTVGGAPLPEDADHRDPLLVAAAVGEGEGEGEGEAEAANTAGHGGASAAAEDAGPDAELAAAAAEDK